MGHTDLRQAVGIFFSTDSKGLDGKGYIGKALMDQSKGFQGRLDKGERVPRPGDADAIYGLSLFQKLRHPVQGLLGGQVSIRYRIC